MAARHQQDLAVVLHNDRKGILTIEDGRLDVLQLNSKDGQPPKRLLSCPARNLLFVKLAQTPTAPGDNRRLDIHCLIGKPSALRLSKMHVLVKSEDAGGAEAWVSTAMIAAYGEGKPYRRVLILVNPIGGKGKAKSVTREQVKPLLDAAGCSLDIRETTHVKHAEEIAREIPLDYDVIACASGDGLIYEVLNGFAVRPDARHALRIPIATIPLGSANTLSLNLFGPKDVFNIPLSCLNIIKGAPLPLNLCSLLFQPSQELRWSFCSVALGLMVDVDVGTEHLRWMGDTRFLVGMVKGMLASPAFKCRIRMKVAQSDKIEIARRARERVQEQGEKMERILHATENGELPSAPSREQGNGAEGGPSANGHHAPNGNGHSDEHSSGAMTPPERSIPDDSWITIESTSKRIIAGKDRLAREADGGQAIDRGGWVDGDSMLYVYAGTMPWADRDLMQWPAATAGSDEMDLVVQRIVPRSTLLSQFTAAENGELFWQESVHYYKVTAFEVENLDPQRQKLISIDGERHPFDNFQLKVHPRMMNTLSMEGRYFVSDFLKKHHLKE